MDNIEAYISTLLKTEAVSPRDELSKLMQVGENELFEDDLFLITAAQKDNYYFFAKKIESSGL